MKHAYIFENGRSCMKWNGYNKLQNSKGKAVMHGIK
jgi:hypothetical protein